MIPAIFLSASVPDPKRDARFHATADIIAIRDAVRALATIALPHRRLVWGGHPAITPLIRVIAESIGITGRDRIVVYQSNFFKGKMSKDNVAFERVVKTKNVEDDLNKSINLMRSRMLESEKFSAGIFIGGMEGVVHEFEMFRKTNPNASLFPVASTGAAALEIYNRSLQRYPSALLKEMAYPTMFRRLLEIE